MYLEEFFQFSRLLGKENLNFCYTVPNFVTLTNVSHPAR